MNFTCSGCGGSFKWKLIADESKHYVSGTACTRVRSISRYCGECHAANEWKRQQGINAYVAEMLASLTPEQRAAYEARKAARS